MDSFVHLLGQFLDLSAKHIALLVALGTILGVVLRFFAPRIWDLFKKRLERRVERSPWERAFPEPNSWQLLASFCDALRLDLDDLDEKSRWEHSRFVPLDAELNVVWGERKRRRVVDLFAGIRAYRHARLFLVIGDPGSGKSVALRKLCRNLLTEVKVARSDRVPIYLNLREWSPSVPWSKDNPPTEDHLRDFILQNVKKRVLGDDLQKFVDKWLLKLLDRDGLFLIFDSFDEIPAVMDSKERSWLVQQLSEVIARTARGGGGGRAVLASRPFRRPRFSDEDRERRPKLRRNMLVFELRPFSDLKIAAAIDHATKDPFHPLRNSETIKHALSRERPDLISIARTPFMLGLMLDYWQAQPGGMPTSQADLYESFISRSLTHAEEMMREHGLDNKRVLACAAAIAKTMFKSKEHGLEMPVAELAKELLNLPVKETVTILGQARIARSSTTAVFSFAHRRFHEYFLIDHFRSEPDKLPLDAIAAEDRWHESLVLFCEVADEPIAKSVADYCWGKFGVVHTLIEFSRNVHKLYTALSEATTLVTTSPENTTLVTALSEATTLVTELSESDTKIDSCVYQQGLHILRFLARAFQARRHLLASFEPQLAEHINKYVRNTEDMLVAKHALEAAGVLSDANSHGFPEDSAALIAL